MSADDTKFKVTQVKSTFSTSFVHLDDKNSVTAGDNWNADDFI